MKWEMFLKKIISKETMNHTLWSRETHFWPTEWSFIHIKQSVFLTKTKEKSKIKISQIENGTSAVCTCSIPNHGSSLMHLLTTSAQLCRLLVPVGVPSNLYVSHRTKMLFPRRNGSLYIATGCK